VCHSPAEMERAHILAPSATTAPIRGPSDLAEVAAIADVALVSRVHGSVGLAALDIPSLCVGTDSRILTAQYVGSRVMHVKQAKCEVLAESLLALHERKDPPIVSTGTIIEYGRRRYDELVSALGIGGV
jgi:hypothetical protein